MVKNNSLPFVSVIVPCRNEERFISKCLESIINNSYPKDKLEVLVVDGLSEDRTREIVGGYVKRYSFMKLLNNSKRIIPAAMNIGIKNAQGEIVMKVDAHSCYERGYISKCVEYLDKYRADNVGGICKIIPRDDTLIGKSIALALFYPFGAGNAYYKIGLEEPKWVDTAPFGCYRKDVFDRIGLYDENIALSEDVTMNSKLRRAGGKILLVPDIVIYYYARSDFKSFCKHNWRNGVWAILPFKYTTIMPVSLRHLVPLIFVLSLIGSGIMSIFSSIFSSLFLLIVGSYLLANIYFSSKIAIQEKNMIYLLIIPVIFSSLHLSYGFGSMVGLVKVLFSKNFWSMHLRKYNIQSHKNF